MTLVLERDPSLPRDPARPLVRYRETWEVVTRLYTLTPQWAIVACDDYDHAQHVARNEWRGTTEWTP